MGCMLRGLIAAAGPNINIMIQLVVRSAHARMVEFQLEIKLHSPVQYANPIKIMNTTFTCSRLSLSDRFFSDMIIMSRSIAYLLKVKYFTVSV